MSELTLNHNHLILNDIDYIIAPFAYHAYYLALKNTRWDLHFQLITKETFLDDVTFTFDLESAVMKIVEAFQMTHQEATLLVSSLQHLPVEKISANGSFQPVMRVYQLLKQENMIKTNPFSDHKYKGKKVLVDGYLQEDAILQHHLKSKHTQATYVKHGLINHTVDVQVFDHIEDEVSSLFNRVAHLLAQGVDLSSIYVVDPGPSYYLELKRQAHYFRIPIQLPNQETLFSLPLGQLLLKHLEEGVDAGAILTNSIMTTHPHWPLVLPVLNRYQTLTFSPQAKLEYARYELKQTRIKEPRFHKAIQVIRDHKPSPTDVVFFLGFIQGRFPATKRDTGYFNDKIKTELGLLTSLQEQKLQTQRFTALIANATQSYVSYPRIDESKVTIPSPWIQSMQMKVVEGKHTVEGTDYGQRLGLIRKVKYEFRAKQFKEINPYLKAYQEAFPDTIQRFDPAYTPIEANPVNKPLRLSYSALKDYYACSFKYFVGRVLKVKPMDQDEFYMHLGTFAHEVFETMGSDLNQFDEVFEKALNNQPELSAKEQVLFAHLKKQLYRVCEFNLLHLANMNQPTTDVEKEMTYQHDEHTSLVGYIDKIMMVRDDQGKEYLSVVDYKSGAESFDEQLIPYGWSLQLPIYALMLQEHPSFQGKEILGLFIQHIIETSMNPKTIEIEGVKYPKSLQLDGIAIADRNKLQWIDKTIRQGQSTFLEGISIIKSGEFKKTNHVKSQEKMASYASLAKEKIEAASQGIRQRSHAINPKMIKGKSSCDYCPFLDTCFRQPSDIQHMDIPKKGLVETDGDTD